MIETAVILICLVFSAFFSSSETAYSSLSKSRLILMKEKNQKGAETALSLHEKYDYLLTTILIGNNIVNIVMASAGTVLFVKILGDSGPSVSTFVVTVLILVLGEVLPKGIAKDYPEKFACVLSFPLKIFVAIFYPLSFLFEKLKRWISVLFGTKDSAPFTTEELLVMFDEGEKTGVLNSDENELLSNTVEFLDCVISDVLTPRNKVVAVDIRASKEQIAKKFEQTEYSRMPVYQRNLNNVVGILHQKDFFTADGISKESVKKLISHPLFVSDRDEAGDVLRRMQDEGIHMAIVRDKKNVTVGVVTMEDLLEELVGEIEDEHD